MSMTGRKSLSLPGDDIAQPAVAIAHAVLEDVGAKHMLGAEFVRPVLFVDAAGVGLAALEDAIHVPVAGDDPAVVEPIVINRVVVAQALIKRKRILLKRRGIKLTGIDLAAQELAHLVFCCGHVPLLHA